MKIGVFGTGYVGLVSGVCLSEVGNTVTCVDVDEQKIQGLKKGISPIYEPGLNELLTHNFRSQRLFFTTQPKEVIESSEILFIAVGTPSDENGSADLRWVFDVANTIGETLNESKIIVLKSTVPVGTNRKVKEIIQNHLTRRGKNYGFHIVSNPEFLREGCAISDCMKPDRVIIGLDSNSEEAKTAILRLYKPFINDANQVLFMDLQSSEMTKYAANAMLATKISFMNEISIICEKLGANIEDIKRGIALDHRIGPHFINAGLGYGGSCFPKDVKALIHVAAQADIETPIMNAVEKINYQQRRRFINRVLKGLKPASQVSVWGIAFKPGTDDIREAPSLDIIKSLIENGHTVRAFDPVAQTNAQQQLKLSHSTLAQKITYFDDQYEVLDKSDVLIIATEWESFKAPDFTTMKKKLLQPTIYDGRNIYDLSFMKSLGFTYHSIGRAGN